MASSAPSPAIVLSDDTLDLPVIELSHWLHRADSDAERVAAGREAERVASSLHLYGLLVVRDPRANESDNDA